jgi:hypothetical protein
MLAQLPDTTDTDRILERRRIATAALAALVAIAIAQLADLMTFLRMITAGGFGMEANPIVIQLADTVGLENVVLLKLALIPFAAVVFVVLARVRAGRLAGSVLTVATLAGFVGAVSNILTVS